MPVVSPLERSSKVFASSSGSVSTSSETPRWVRIRSIASARMVRLMRPRKSNFRRPSASQACISNWVMVVLPSVARWSGMISVSGSRLITIPAAWVEAWRATPSSCLAIPISLSTRSSPAISSRSWGEVSTARSRRDVQLVGDRLGDAVRLRVGEAHGPPGVADGGLGAERPEGDDLRHPVVAVLAGDVGDHLVAARVRRSRCRCPASSPGPGSGSARRAARTRAGRPG